MLSYNVILAIQILHLLSRADKEGLSVSALKHKADMRPPGLPSVVRRLLKLGWLKREGRAGYLIAADLAEKTLYDLVTALDGEAPTLGRINDRKEHHPLWGERAKEKIPHAMAFDQRLGGLLNERLRNTGMMELITESWLPVSAIEI